jgi:uncharacterized circularly permuted ATP-grasp superfamily protein/uncharacterized alpha-E superfamily protein
LNLVLQDLYGAQKLLHDGLLPPAIIHANPGFIRPCHGMQVPSGRFLTLHAVDLTRAPDGSWWVLSDRTQAPSGVGYTLENRIILSRILSDEFRGSNVERLASFFIARKAGLRAMAPWTDTPNTVLLTPGPLTETYFEHAYLARYLGFPLVEGNDLTVRDRKVYIKTLEGLQRVDVIIRRVDDVFCDPLELRSDSFLGVPGLAEAARAGNVALSNALGSGAVEAPALLAFLPALSRHLLGEELRIPNVATWWCGQERERKYAFDRVRSLVVKRAFVVGRGAPAFCATLDATALDKLVAKMRAHPYDYVGQEEVALSTTPVWTGQNVEVRRLILRCYVAATPDGFVAMQGGLCRVSASSDSPIVTSQYGGGSKDTWVIGKSPVEEVTLLDTRGAPLELHRATALLPSRVVDNFFWLGRYAERLENNTRLFRTALSRLTGEGGPEEDAELNAITRCLRGLEMLPARYEGKVHRRELLTALRELVFAHKSAGSLRDLLSRINYLTASLRDRFSGDTWRVLNHLQTEFTAPQADQTAGGVLAILHRLIAQLAAFSGMEMENMTRGHAWQFLEIGRRLERAGNVVQTIQALLRSGEAWRSGLAPLLEYCDSTMTYRRRYFARPEWPTTLDLLLADPSNPRSFAFQIEALRKSLAQLPATTDDKPERLKVAEIEKTLETADWNALGSGVPEGKCDPLHEFLTTLAVACWSVSDFLTLDYFSHVRSRAH